MLKAGDIVDYKGSLYIIQYEEVGWLQMNLITDDRCIIVFDNYYNFVDDLQLVVGTEGKCLCLRCRKGSQGDCQLVPVKPKIVFNKMIKKHGLV
jgi:hypothetical protein